MDNNNENNQEVEMSREDFLAQLSESSIGGTPSNVPISLAQSQENEKSQLKNKADALEAESAKEVEETEEIPVVEKEPVVEKVVEVAKQELKIASLDMNATYKIKVDGKEIEIKGSDLQSRASGEIAVEKRFLAIDKEKKEWLNKRQAETDSDKKRILEGDIYGVLSDKFDIPVYTLKEKLLNELQPDFNRRMSMTNEQVQAEKLIQERKFYKDSYESEINRRAEDQKQEAQSRIKAEEDSLNQEILEVRETHKISDNEWKAAFEALDKTTPQDEDVSVEMVKDYVLNSVRQSSEETSSLVVDKALEPYKAHINSEFKQKLQDFIKLTPDLSEADINKIVKASVKRGLEMQLTDGQESVADQKQETREEFLNRIQEESLSKAIGAKDTSKNWF